MQTQTHRPHLHASRHRRTRPFHKSIDERALAEKFAFEHGQTYDSYLACEADRQFFFSSDGKGAISYTVVLGHAKVGGGLLAAPEDRPRLLGEFLRMVKRNYNSAAFFNITDEDLYLFRRFGMHVTKWGEDAILDLPKWSPKGGAFEWLRRQKNFCQRAGLVTGEWFPTPTNAVDLIRTQAELRVVELESIQDKPQACTMRFFEGQLDFEHLDRKRIFITRSEQGQGRIEAFVVANPYDDGRGWAFEMYRHRMDSVRGAVPFTMLQAIDTLRSEGADQVSLCLLPGHNCVTDDRQSSRLIRGLMNFGIARLQCLFDVEGLWQFKTRFRPHLDSRYICTFPRANAMTIATSVHLLGVLYVSPMKVIKRWLQMRSRPKAK